MNFRDREGSYQKSLLSDEALRSDSVERMCRLYEESKVRGGWEGPNLSQVANDLGWSEARLRKRLRENYFEGWGETTVTTRGEVVRSKLEMKVAGYFYRSEIPYQYEPDLKYIHKPDFILKDGIAVEIWGVQDDPKYTQRRKDKEQMYAESAWGLVSLEPLDVSRLSEIFPIKSREASVVEYATEGQANLRDFD